jgi:tetratricopeptide (TPR) repeat protein
MAHHRLGHGDEARQWLEKATQEWRRLSPLPRAPGDRTILPSTSEALVRSWHDWIVFEILLSEANALILGHRSEADCLDLLHQAYLHTKLGDFKKADEEFQAAVRGRAKDAKAWLARGRVYRLLGDKERAEADFAKAYELNRDDAQIQKEYEASRGEKKKRPVSKGAASQPPARRNLEQPGVDVLDGGPGHNHPFA